MTSAGTGGPPRIRIWAGRVFALAVCVLGALILVVTGILWWRAQPSRSFGSDLVQRLTPETPAPLLPSRTADGSRRPVQLTIPGIAITAKVVPIGVDAHGGLNTPPEAGALGWYQDGRGLDATTGTVLAERVDDVSAGLGACVRFGRLAPGMALSLTTDDGASVDYRVVAREEYPKADVDLSRYLNGTAGPRLTLITCGGAFDDTTGSYRDNVIVTAVPE